MLLHYIQLFACQLNIADQAMYVPLREEKLKQFRLKLKNIAYVISDEVSMVLCPNFKICSQDCGIKNTTCDPTILWWTVSDCIL